MPLFVVIGLIQACSAILTLATGVWNGKGHSALIKKPDIRQIDESMASLEGVQWLHLPQDNPDEIQILGPTIDGQSKSQPYSYEGWIQYQSRPGRYGAAIIQVDTPRPQAPRPVVQDLLEMRPQEANAGEF
ncbi:hypothetical protein MBLNU459_g6460t1 [Dothideomycetes sp. NU459]